MRYLSIALPCGKLLMPAVEFLAKIGISCDSISGDARKKIFFDNKRKYRLIVLEPFDIPVYVERGGADLAIVTRDILLEMNLKVMELLELNFGEGKLLLAGLEENSCRTLGDIYKYSVLATNYPNIAHNYFLNRGIPIEIVKLSPPLALALDTGLADLILTFASKDILRKEIITITEICNAPNLLIANRISFKKYFNQIHFLINRMKEVLEENSSEAVNGEEGAVKSEG